MFAARRDDPCSRGVSAQEQRDSGPGRPVRRQLGRGRADPACRATHHGRWRSAWRRSGMRSASISRRIRSMPHGTCSPRTRSRPSPSSPTCRIAEGERVAATMAALVEDARWRTSAQGRRYMMATLSDSSGQFVATAFDDEASAALEAAAKARQCGLLSVELDRRAGDETPRVTIKRIAAADRPRQADAAADDRPRVEPVMVARSFASWPARAARNGVVRFVVPLASGGEAIVVAGRDFALDARARRRASSALPARGASTSPCRNRRGSPSSARPTPSRSRRVDEAGDLARSAPRRGPA